MVQFKHVVVGAFATLTSVGCAAPTNSTRDLEIPFTKVALADTTVATFSERAKLTLEGLKNSTVDHFNDIATDLVARGKHSTDINCYFICNEESAIFNECACKAACKKKRDKKDCHEEVHKKKKVKALMNCYFSGDPDRGYDVCFHNKEKKVKHRHKCAQAALYEKVPKIKAWPHSHSCYDELPLKSANGTKSSDYH